jgi:NADH-quinone oxidoreductase subunit L
MIVSTVVAVSGIGLAYTIYYKKKISAEALGAKLRPIYKLLYNKYYIDEIYDLIIIKPVLKFARMNWWFDANIIDGLVNFTGWITVKWADLKMLFDKYIIDGAVNGIGHVCMAGSWLLKFIQTGRVQFYTLIVIAVSIMVVMYKIAPDGAVWFLAGILVIAFLRMIFRISRPERAEIK